MAEEEKGVLHHKIKFNDRVYLVGDIDELLSLKQDALVAGDGIKIDGSVISLAKLPKQEVKTTHDVVFVDVPDIPFNTDHKFYMYNHTSADPTPLVIKLSGIMGETSYDTVVECVLMVRIANTTSSVTFSAELPIVYVGDTDFSVVSSNQVLYIAVRSFAGKIVVSKLGTF